MNQSTLIKLTNPQFDIEFDGNKYTVRKANLDKFVQYQARVAELIKIQDPAKDVKVTAYCIYLILRDVYKDITEKEVLDKTPADIDVIETLTELGFINPRKIERARQIQEETIKRLITEKSLPTSPKEQDGVQTP